MKPFLPLLLFLGMLSCMSQPKKFTEKKFLLTAKETVHINELGITITNPGCGRQWISEKDKPAFERAYCDITVKTNDTTWYLKDSLFIKNIRLVLDRINPWGSMEDSIPPYGCRIIVTNLGDLSP